MCVFLCVCAFVCVSVCVCVCVSVRIFFDRKICEIEIQNLSPMKHKILSSKSSFSFTSDLAKNSMSSSSLATEI